MVSANTITTPVNPINIPMKNLTRSFVSSLVALGMFQLSIVAVHGADQIPAVPAVAKSTPPAPKIVSAGKPLSAQQLAKYQQQASTADVAANQQAAGASSNTTLWVVVGVVVVVRTLTLASSSSG